MLSLNGGWTSGRVWPFGFSQEKRKCTICDPAKAKTIRRCVWARARDRERKKVEKKMIETREINEFVQNIVLLYWSLALPAPLPLSRLQIASIFFTYCSKRWTSLIFLSLFRGAFVAIVVVLNSVAHRTGIKVLNCFVKYLRLRPEIS